MSQETILVTGAAGGVGSTAHTAIAILLEQGHRVRAMVRKLDGRADTLRYMGAEIVVADMLDIIGARGHAKLLSGAFHHVDLAQLPGSGHQRCSRSVGSPHGGARDKRGLARRRMAGGWGYHRECPRPPGAVGNEAVGNEGGPLKKDQ